MVPVRIGGTPRDFSLQPSTGARGSRQKRHFGAQAGWPAHLLPGRDGLSYKLRVLFSKTAGIVPLLKAELERFGGKVKWAAIYGSIARGEEQAQSDIDLLVVSPVGMTELLPALRRVEQQFGREVNVTRYSESEFFSKRHGRDHFLNSILKGKLITIAGSLNELEKATGRKQSPRAQDK